AWLREPVTMATGHVLPAQRGEAVSNLYRAHEEQRRSKTAGAAATGGIKPSFIPENNNRRWLLTQAPVASDRLEAIRRQAREMWSGRPPIQQRQQLPQPQSQQPLPDQTSYQRHYSAKRLDEPTLLRPTSPNRRNNPHPPMVFLTCRLHNVPGFNNPDGVTGKPTYQVDASRSQSEQVARQRQRAKFADRPDDGALRQYADKDPVEEVFGQKLEFRVSSLGRLPDDESDEDFAQARRRMTDWQRSAQPSLHRYMKYQGPVERERLRAVSGRRHPECGSGQQARWASVSADRHPRGLVYQPTRVRGDYLIHPMWPPTLPHHWVP
uniref:ZM domain-containing protein n=2 Tax=Macrostomum lignano TaxID=282301 RepID=A0A1I8H635_9PLAT